MSEAYTRLMIAYDRFMQLKVQADLCTDLDRMTAIRAEMEVIAANMHELRREQMAEQLPKPKPAPWWRRLFGRGGGG